MLANSQSVQADSMQEVADGRPWVFKAAAGRAGKLTLHPDGTGTMRAGFMKLNASWRRVPGGFCMKSRMTGERCVSLRRLPNGFSAYNQNTLKFTLTR